MKSVIVLASVVVAAAASATSETPRPAAAADAGAREYYDAGVPADGSTTDGLILGADTSPVTPSAAALRQSRADVDLSVKLTRLAALEKEASFQRTMRMRALKRARTSAIVITALGVAAQIAGAIDLASGLGTTQPPATAFVAVGSHPFIDAVVGTALSIIGIVMWPVGTSRWVDSQRQIHELSQAGEQ